MDYVTRFERNYQIPYTCSWVPPRGQTISRCNADSARDPGEALCHRERELARQPAHRWGDVCSYKSLVVLPLSSSLTILQMCVCVCCIVKTAFAVRRI